MKHLPRNKGAAIITAVMFFVIIATAMAIGLSSPVVREYTTARDFAKSKGAYYLSEAGSEDALYRIKKAKPISAQEIISLGGNTATTTITDITASQKEISSLGDILLNTRRVKSKLTTSSGESFSYGVQAGAGGVLLQNSSTITGSLFSAGPIIGSNNLVTGTVIAGGTTGLNGSITGVFNQGGSHMYAGTISNSTISGSAYCNTISGSNRTSCETLTAQVAQPFPITAQDIANWETAAALGGMVTCSGGKYAINDSASIGPKKIPCDLEITGTGSGGGPVITLGGPIWVTGNIKIKNHLTIRVDPTLVGQSIVMVSDNPTNHLTSSTVSVEGEGLNFAGAPGGNSWIMLISENNGASLGQPNEAIELEQGAQGDILLYSRLGDILLKNSASVKEVTGYKITLQNNANVTYASGLQNALFTSGPGGTWTIQDWKEGQ
ncbi:MAG: hypothetical protein AAB497_02395 [Patescibacteria group bacterium]